MPKRLIEAILNPQTLPDQSFKDDRRSRVVRVTIDGRAWVVKQYRGPVWKRWLEQLLRRTPAWREWRYGEKLRVSGVRAIQPLALVHTRTGQALITPFIDAPSLHHWLKQSPAAGSRLALARVIGEQIGRIIAAGLINRDHKASNLLIDAACERGDAEPILIDPARLKRRRGDATVWLMIARLWRSARLAGPCSSRECLAVVRHVLRTNPTLLAGRHHRLKRAVRAIQDTDARLQRLLEAASASRARMCGSDPPDRIGDDPAR